MARQYQSLKRTRIGGFHCMSATGTHALCEGSGCAFALPVALSDLCEKCKTDILCHGGYLFFDMLNRIATDSAPSVMSLIMVNCISMEFRLTKSGVTVQLFRSTPAGLKQRSFDKMIIDEYLTNRS